jgi:hypothetical protein
MKAGFTYPEFKRMINRSAPNPEVEQIEGEFIGSGKTASIYYNPKTDQWRVIHNRTLGQVGASISVNDAMDTFEELENR